jgi:hypothetical protein
METSRGQKRARPSPTRTVRENPLGTDQWGINGRSLPQLVASARANSEVFAKDVAEPSGKEKRAEKTHAETH